MSNDAQGLAVGSRVIGQIEAVEVTERGATIKFKVRLPSNPSMAPVPGILKTKGLTKAQSITLRPGVTISLFVEHMTEKGVGPVTLSFEPPKLLDFSNLPSKGDMALSYSKAPREIKTIEDTNEEGEIMEAEGTGNRPLTDTATAKQATNNSNSIPKRDMILLNNLKVGQQLVGKIVSLTSYAAFVDAQVFRMGKRGRATKINGMLHHTDLVPGFALSSRYDQLSENARVLQTGSRVKLYVKDVLPNSARFSLTLDPNFTKDKLKEEKLKFREEGKTRRRERRLRRMVSQLQVGQQLDGLVEKVVGDYVLVSVAAINDLKAVGVAMWSDMPADIEVPGYLSVQAKNAVLKDNFNRNDTVQVEVLAKGETAVQLGVIGFIEPAPPGTSVYSVDGRGLEKAALQLEVNNQKEEEEEAEELGLEDDEDFEEEPGYMSTKFLGQINIQDDDDEYTEVDQDTVAALTTSPEIVLDEDDDLDEDDHDEDEDDHDEGEIETEEYDNVDLEEQMAQDRIHPKAIELVQFWETQSWSEEEDEQDKDNEPDEPDEFEEILSLEGTEDADDDEEDEEPFGSADENADEPLDLEKIFGKGFVLVTSEEEDDFEDLDSYDGRDARNATGKGNGQASRM